MDHFAKIPLFGVENGSCRCKNPNCKVVGKHPKIFAWNKRPSSWKPVFSKGDNVGIITGHINGIFVLDIDVRNNGDVELEKLESKFGKLPPTLSVKTGGGGTHHYFKYVQGIKNSSGKIASGIDIKSDGGFVVAPPSNHKSGLAYHWLTEKGLNQEISDAPSWLIEMAKNTQTKEPNKNRNKHLVYDLNLRDIACSLFGSNKSFGPGDWLVCCPAHDDRTPSLHLTLMTSGKLLWHCFAGCSQMEVWNEFKKIINEEHYDTKK